VDTLSHKKKAAFWRELIEMLPNMIDYICNPDVDPVCHRVPSSYRSIEYASSKRHRLGQPRTTSDNLGTL
jgi:hypothetical protein